MKKTHKKTPAEADVFVQFTLAEQLTRRYSFYLNRISLHVTK